MTFGSRVFSNCLLLTSLPTYLFSKKESLTIAAHHFIHLFPIPSPRILTIIPYHDTLPTKAEFSTSSILHLSLPSYMLLNM